MGSRPDIAGNLAAVAKIATIDDCLHGTSVEQKLMLLVPESDGSGRAFRAGWAEARLIRSLGFKITM